MPTNDALPPLKETIARHGLDAKKSLGQHFLLDLNITRKIVRLADVSDADTVLEVGPGPGGLTRALLETGARVIAIERDARCIEAMNELSAFYPGQLTVVEGDALKVDEDDLLAGTRPFKIVSNLPYNISTELLVKWLHLSCSTSTTAWSVMALMFQREVVDRIISTPNNGTYGRLSVIAQATSHVARGLDLPARAFTPPPKVDSSVAVFQPKSVSIDLTRLERLTQAAFGQRRKMLRTSTKAVFGDQAEERLIECGIKPTDRAENVEVDDYVSLARSL
ncbi:MAG: 16S rRNA (adenine(1518)-N(6)/adenine(1519)-N(6))-dimethyltransferase RsmA [Pseudomonadota bacterium]